MSCIAVSPDGGTLLTRSSDLKRFDLSTKKRMVKFAGHLTLVTALAFRADGKSVISSATGEGKREDQVKSTDEGHGWAESKAPKTRRCECHDMFNELVPYVDAWRWQKETVERISAAEARGETTLDSVVILQHPSVYTMGTRSSDSFLRFDKDDPPYELHRTERGGEVTYHGPGQLVMYPIINLRHQKTDLHWYLRMLEEVVIRSLWSACSLRATRLDGLTGVWVGDAKVAAIGVRVSRWITYHGLALNVNTDLSHFQHIVPCGIGDRPVSSVQQLLLAKSVLGELPDVTGNTLSSSSRVEPSSEVLESMDTKLLDCLHLSLLSEFAEIFQMKLEAPTNKGPQHAVQN